MDWLVELRRQIAEWAAESGGQQNPLAQSILGFLEFLGTLFGLDDDNSTVDGQGHVVSGDRDDDDDLEHDRGSGSGNGRALFNGIRPRSQDLTTWAEFQRGAGGNPVVHISPVDDPNVVVTSDRGERGGRTHHGLDLDTTTSGIRPNIVASADGVVLLTGYFPERNGRPNYGNTVIIGHADGSYTVYAHLRSIDSDLRPGQMVNQNDVIGVMGNSGGDVGVHLHYEQRVGSRSRDPIIQGRTFADGNALPDLAASGVEYTSADAEITLDTFIESLRRSGALAPVQR